MYFSHKMKVHCYKCGAKLGYSNYGLSPLNKDKRAYKIKIKALDVISNHTEVTTSTESSSRIKRREKAGADEARPGNTAQPFNERTLKFLRRCGNRKEKEEHDIDLLISYIFKNIGLWIWHVHVCGACAHAK